MGGKESTPLALEAHVRQALPLTAGGVLVRLAPSPALPALKTETAAGRHRRPASFCDSAGESVKSPQYWGCAETRERLNLPGQRREQQDPAKSVYMIVAEKIRKMSGFGPTEHPQAMARR